MIPIVVTIDENYAQHLGVMLTSLFENNQGLDFHIFVFYEKLSENNKKKLKQITQNYQQTISFLEISIQTIQDFKVHAHASLANYFRLLAFSKLPPEINKAIYLDVDLLVLQSIEALWNTDLTNKLLGVVAEKEGKYTHILNIPTAYPYFNSGVMLVNIALWKAEEMTQKTLNFIANNPDKIYAWDQDALNELCYDKCIFLEEKWNVQSGKVTDKQHEKTIYQNAIILHFTGPSKPWQYLNKKPYKKLYYQYLRKTPWKNYQPTDRSIGNFLRKNKLMPKWYDRI